MNFDKLCVHYAVPFLQIASIDAEFIKAFQSGTLGTQASLTWPCNTELAITVPEFPFAAGL